jgi:hypothetical protein
VAVALHIGGTLALADLYDDEPGHLHGSFQVPLPVPTNTATLELFEVGRAYESETYGTWGIPMEVFDANMPPQARLVDETHRPNRSVASPPIVANGYRIVAIGERYPEGGIINVDITVGASPSYPGGEYAVSAEAGHRTLEGVVNKDAPGRLSGRIVFPDSVHETSAGLVLRGFDPGRFVADEQLSIVAIALPAKADFVPGSHAFTVDVGPGALASSHMEIADAGFMFEGTYELVNGKRAVSFQVRMNPLYDRQLFPIGS